MESSAELELRQGKSKARDTSNFSRVFGPVVRVVSAAALPALEATCTDLQGGRFCFRGLFVSLTFVVDSCSCRPLFASAFFFF